MTPVLTFEESEHHPAALVATLGLPFRLEILRDSIDRGQEMTLATENQLASKNDPQRLR
jgi:hypothetical protein